MSEVTSADDVQPKAVVDEVKRVGLIRLSEVEPRFRTADFHPSMEAVDSLQKELIFHAKLVRMTWSLAHVRTLIIGLTAMLLGAVSPEIWGGGDAMTGGLQGVKAIDGSGFFMLITSIGLWMWFLFEIWNLFPVMKGHSVSLVFAWMSLMMSMVLFHTDSPGFPFDIGEGNLLGGIVCIFIMAFIIYIFWKAVQETRDQHVEEVHFSPDERKMEEAMGEHSLAGWATILILWSISILIGSWAGVHYVAERQLSMPGLLVLHVVMSCIGVYGLMHLLWFPQLMLGVGTTKVLSRRAREAMADLEAQLANTPAEVVIKNDGECPECGADVPINRSEEGEAKVSCQKEGCSGSGLVSGKCDVCKARIPSRHTCASCGINAPVLDFLSDSEAW